MCWEKFLLSQGMKKLLGLPIAAASKAVSSNFPQNQWCHLPTRAAVLLSKKERRGEKTTDLKKAVDIFTVQRIFSTHLGKILPTA